ncbi:UNVERIFIED_CONTAM: hypothetical protein GTU68_057885, partial [Idotea baltica]|nr:hypothetical protein [Idotea baltica]
MNSTDPGFLVSLLAGGAAGFAVDVSLFPLDTIKTRLQSEAGFFASGGFRKIYNGLGPAALGSAPNAALFFCTYEYAKKILSTSIPEQYEFVNHASAASLGELAACIIRVPTEVLKQRRQASLHSSSLAIFRDCVRREGALGLYRGYWSTAIRDIPFSFIQFPLWEFFKKRWSIRKQREVEPWESAVAGSVSGGLAAALTTPLDVAKTRIMLAKEGSAAAQGRILAVLRDVFRSAGVKGIYSGVLPRTMWMSLGGGVYFGVYEFTKYLLLSA